MGKLLFAIPRKTVQRNQFVIREGQLAESFFVVFEGEFEMYKTVSFTEKLKFNPSEYLKKKEFSDHQTLARAAAKAEKTVQKTKNILLGNLGSGQLFGLVALNHLDEEGEDQNTTFKYQTSVRCLSATGVVMVFKKKETFSKLRLYGKTWKFLKNYREFQSGTIATREQSALQLMED